MMIESGGYASIVGPGGYYGLFQYHPSTWKGSWNPYRSASITDGARADPRHGARPPDGVRARLVGSVLLLGVLG